MANKYFQIVNGNAIFTRLIIDRDSYEITSCKSVIKIWLKISYNNKNSVAYQKVFYFIYIEFILFFYNYVLHSS